MDFERYTKYFFSFKCVSVWWCSDMILYTIIIIIIIIMVYSQHIYRGSSSSVKDKNKY